jgi:hypothetical protein
VSGRNAARIAWVLCGLTLALIACAVLLAALSRVDLSNISYLAAMVLGAVLGGLVASRRPTTPSAGSSRIGAFCRNPVRLGTVGALGDARCAHHADLLPEPLYPTRGKRQTPAGIPPVTPDRRPGFLDSWRFGRLAPS